MRMIWWFVVVFTLTGSLMDMPSQPAPADEAGQVNAKDGSGEPPRPPKP
jgi:hypothetical protein